MVQRKTYPAQNWHKPSSYSSQQWISRPLAFSKAHKCHRILNQVKAKSYNWPKLRCVCCITSSKINSENKRKEKTKWSFTLRIQACVYAPHEVRIESGLEIHQTHMLSRRRQDESRSGYHPEPATQEEAKSIRSLQHNFCSAMLLAPKPTLSVEWRERCQPSQSEAFIQDAVSDCSSAELTQRENKSVPKWPMDGRHQQCPVY